MKLRYILSILSCLLLIGCSSGLKPIKFENGLAKPNHVGKPVIEVITNSVKVVRPAQIKELEVDLPVTVSIPKQNLDTKVANKDLSHTNKENISVTIPQKLKLTVIIPESTNNFVVSGLVREKSILNPSAVVVYFICVGSLFAIGLYIWRKTQKNKLVKNKLKTNSSVLTTEN